MAIDDRIMFEIYREADYARRYCVVYFTELDENNKEREINRAMAGEHFYDGFIDERTKDQAKRVIADVIERLNTGEPVDEADIDARLAGITPC